jgi:hypothetical protein
MTQARTKKQPRVGIFWLFKGRLILDSTPVSQGEAYGGNVGHATAHIDYWSRLQERGEVPREVEYEEFPRGRVGELAKRLLVEDTGGLLDYDRVKEAFSALFASLSVDSSSS